MTVLSLVTDFHAAIQGTLAGLTAWRTVLAAFAGSFTAGVLGTAVALASL